MPLWDYNDRPAMVWAMLAESKRDGFEPKVFTNKEDAEEYLEKLEVHLDEKYPVGELNEMMNIQNWMFECKVFSPPLVKSASKK